MISKYFLPALVFVLMAFGITLALWQATQSASAQISDGPFYTITSASSTSVLTTSKQIVATSTGRRYLEINNLAGFSIYCAYNDVAATVTTGFFITASSSKQWVAANLYTGAIRCIAPATANVTVNEVN